MVVAPPDPPGPLCLYHGAAGGGTAASSFAGNALAGRGDPAIAPRSQPASGGRVHAIARSGDGCPAGAAAAGRKSDPGLHERASARLPGFAPAIFS